MPPQCLIADDDQFITLLLKRFAIELGFQVVTARVGQDVIRRVQKHPPQVIILDPDLPGGNVRGWDVLQNLKQNEKTTAIPIIVCSWSSDITEFDRFGGVQGFLQKPEIHFEDFLNVVKTAGIVND
jgi:CheY-like chemotaxis protein